LLRVTLKTFWLIAHLIYGLCIGLLIRVSPAHRRRRESIAGVWHTGLLRLLGLRVKVQGQPAESVPIIVANHVSWLDVSVLGSMVPTRFLSKAEVKGWPIAGFLATSVGTFYLVRGAGGTKQLTRELVEAVNSGSHVTFFPEGTTTDGVSTLRFQPRLFATAIETGKPVQPVAFRYGLTADGRNIAPFIDDDDMVSHLLRVMREPGLEVEVVYCPPIESAGLDRASLALAAQNAVLDVIAPDRERIPAKAAKSAEDDDQDTMAA
jgi:1-acyl-sn-glycerol-3-phosphate acyltransferase